MNELLLPLLIIINFVSMAAVANIDTGSAYDRLRLQYEQAKVPAVEDLSLGRIWYCSGVLEAAKGQLRYVQFWESRYRFVIGPSQGLANTMNSRLEVLNYLHSEMRLVQKLAPNFYSYDFVRVNSAGDLVVEVAFDENQRSFAEQSSRIRWSLSEPELLAQQYFLCENPIRHENRDWGGDPDSLFSGEDKKRAAASGSF